MKVTTKIDIAPLTRVEGHGNIRIALRNGILVEAAWEVVESPRFFEAMLVGKRWEDVPWICGRICGICSIGHTLASIRAIENAFGIVPTEQTRKLRLLLKHMETLQSHTLHLFFLVAPDLLGTGSVLPLVDSRPDLVRLALRLKGTANDLCDRIGGRRLHPIRTVVGGFTRIPSKQDLASFVPRLREAASGLRAAVELFRTVSLPEFSRETEFVSLRGETEYPFLGGDLMSSDGVRKRECEYREMTNEYSVERSTAKWCRLSRDSFAVGALARVNNNFDRLHPEAKRAADAMGLSPVEHNPFRNNTAQLVESVHVVHDALRLVEELLEGDPVEPRQPVTPRAGAGVSAVEVPRGILYHAYEFDGEGRVLRCDCVIPTGQNHGNIQRDLEALAASSASRGMPDREIERLAEMLVRAYDPCISCSVH
ncbi:MAG: Ni/Fe hydrogenase subunit alpha [Deltaproteobacteria bacterium]